MMTSSVKMSNPSLSWLSENELEMANGLLQLDGMTGDKVAQAHWIYKQGLSFAQIAKAIYVSRRAVMANKKAIKNYKEGGAE